MDFLIKLQDFLAVPPQVLAALIASLVAIWGILSQRQLSRQKNSLDFESTYKRNKEISEANNQVIELIQHLRKLRKDNNQDEADKELKRILIDDISADCKEIDRKYFLEKRQAVTTVINEWERASNAVFSNLYDEDYLYRAHATSIIQIYTYLRLYIELRQEVVPRYYINFSRLALRWSRRRCIEDDTGKCAKKLKTTLKSVNGAGVQFKEHKVVETHDGALEVIAKAEHDIWLIINKPSIYKRILKWFKLIKH